MISFDSEKCFEQFIIQEFEKDNVCIIDDCEYQECVSQFDTKTYGIPDLVFVGFDFDLDKDDNPIERARIHVVELKNEQIKLSHIAQIARYKTYFQRAFDGKEVDLSFSLVVPKGVGAGDEVCWVINHLDEIDIYEFELNPSEGIEFRQTKGWFRQEENFAPALGLIGSSESHKEGDGEF